MLDDLEKALHSLADSHEDLFASPAAKDEFRKSLGMLLHSGGVVADAAPQPFGPGDPPPQPV